MPILADVDAVLLGTTPVTAIYARDTLVWPTVAKPPYLVQIDATTLKLVDGIPSAFYLAWWTSPYRSDGSPLALNTTPLQADANGEALIPLPLWGFNPYQITDGVLPPGAYAAQRLGEPVAVELALHIDGYANVLRYDGLYSRYYALSVDNVLSYPPAADDKSPLNPYVYEYHAIGLPNVDNADVSTMLIHAAEFNHCDFAPEWTIVAGPKMLLSRYGSSGLGTQDLRRLFSYVPGAEGTPGAGAPFPTETGPIWEGTLTSTTFTEIDVPAGFLEGTIALSAGGNRAANPAPVGNWVPSRAQGEDDGMSEGVNTYLRYQVAYTG